jgi:hypothetical protein
MRITNIFTLMIFLWATNVYGQTLEEAEKALKKIKKIEQIDKLKAEHPDWSISLDKTPLSDSLDFPAIVKAKIGDIVLKQYNPNAPKFVMKVLEVDNEEVCKVKYIYLNGKKYSKSEIDSLRALIMNRYSNGEDFETLVKEYTMDSNPTGDLGWFYKGMMVDKFDSAVRNRAKGEIFTIDIEDNSWYYVVLKNHDNKLEKIIKSVMIEYKM